MPEKRPAHAFAKSSRDHGRWGSEKPRCRVCRLVKKTHDSVRYEMEYSVKQNPKQSTRTTCIRLFAYRSVPTKFCTTHNLYATLCVQKRTEQVLYCLPTKTTTRNRTISHSTLHSNRSGRVTVNLSFPLFLCIAWAVRRRCAQNFR